MEKHASHTKKPAHHHTGSSRSNLEVYAFWTGFASTIISLIHVLILAVK
ncbi:MAG TPA: hypothetical protein VF829_03260 [Candidatus Paceibacterota bacterium]